MLIDLEVMAGGLIRTERVGEGRGGAHVWRMWNSVLRTGLLPGRGPAADGRSYLEGGLAGHGATHPVERRTWRRVNTDLMTLVTEQVVLPSGSGPRLGEHPVDVMGYRDAVLHGVRVTLDLVVRHRAALLDPTGPLDAVRRLRTRAVLRDTRIYDSVLQRARHPQFLRDGVAWATELEVLRAADTAANREPLFWAARAAEQVELRRLDIPLFTAIADERVLRCGCDLSQPHADRQVPLAMVPDAFEESGFDELLARLRALDAAEIARQLAMVRIALTDTDPPRRRPRAVESARPRLTRAVAHTEARQLRHHLAQLAVDDGDGGLTWVGFVEAAGSSRAGLQPLALDLFSGRAGVALFLAAVARCVGDDDAAQLARRALGPVARMAHQASGGFRAVESLDVGGATGLAGTIYALETVGTLLRAPDLCDGARALARALTPDRIRQDAAFNVTSGVAGALLVLLRLQRTAYDPRLDGTIRRASYRVPRGRAA